jgi:hypothetical protein
MILVPFTGQHDVKECSSTQVKIGLCLLEAVGAPGKSHGCRSPGVNSYRCVIFPFTGKFQGSQNSYSVDVEGFANMARQVVLDIYSAEHPGMAIELADIRLFYLDVDGDQVEIVSDTDICFAIREYTYKMGGKNLRITSPLVKKENDMEQASAIADVAAKLGPATSPSTLPVLDAQPETESASTSTQTEIKESGRGVAQMQATDTSINQKIHQSKHDEPSQEKQDKIDEVRDKCALFCIVSQRF